MDLGTLIINGVGEDYSRELKINTNSNTWYVIGNLNNLGNNTYVDLIMNNVSNCELIEGSGRVSGGEEQNSFSYYMESYFGQSNQGSFRFTTLSGYTFIIIVQFIED